MRRIVFFVGTICFIACNFAKTDKGPNKHNTTTQFFFEDSYSSDVLDFSQVDTLINFSLKHLDKRNGQCSFHITGIAKNIDPEGGMAFDEFDPENMDSPTEVLNFSDEKYSILIAIPLTKSSFVGIDLERKTENICKKSYKLKLQDNKKTTS